MKILVSGCTALQIGSTNRQIQKIDVPASIVDALRLSGHEVEWRKIKVGEDLSSYDVIWLNLAPINSLNGRAGAMGALYALTSGIPTVGFFDDWQFHTVFNGMKAVMRKPAMLTKYMLVGKDHRGDEVATHFSKESVEAAYNRILTADPSLRSRVSIDRYYYMDTDEEIEPYRERLLAALSQFQVERWQQGMVPVCPMYSWGDKSLVRKRMPAAVGPIEPLDPSSTIYPLIGGHQPLPPAEKSRTWMLGALMPHDEWLSKKDITWDVEFLGSQKMIRKFGGERVKTESDVLDRYNTAWGILSPPYPHAGSGWWRSRFMYAARIGSILVCDKGEGDPLGSAYKATISQVEAMSDDQLVQLAADQAAALRPYMPAAEQFVAHVNSIVERAAREDKGLRFDG